jgi:hypothetical protein
MRSIPVISFVTLVWYSIAIRRSGCQNSGSIVTEVFCPRSTRVRLLGRPVSVLTPARNACTRRWTPPRRFAWFGAKVLQSAAERATTNPYGITLSHVWTDWAAQHGVSETIAAALWLISRNRKVGEVVVKLTPGEMERVVAFVQGLPDRFPPGPSPPSRTADPRLRARRPPHPTPPSAPLCPKRSLNLAASRGGWADRTRKPHSRGK